MDKPTSDLTIAELSVLHEISSLSFSGSEKDFAEEATEKAARLFGARRLALFIGPKDNRQLLASWGFKDVEDICRSIEQKMPNQFYCVFGDSGELGALFMEQAHPVEKREERLYIIFAQRLENGLATARDIAERKQLEGELKESKKYFLSLAGTVSRILAFRDPYTGSHQERVTELAGLIGAKMELDRERLDWLHFGALIHDIGKVAVPETILSKPGELTEEEWALVRSHVKRGYEILREMNLPSQVTDMALHHHERLDGSGYPHGISGNKLNLEVRILGVCDVVEAMSSHRPYRPARSKEEVVAELREGRGIKYDAQVVDIILEMIEQGEFDLTKLG